MSTSMSVTWTWTPVSTKFVSISTDLWDRDCICADTESVGLSYDAYWKLNMPICTEQAVLNKNTCHFLGPWPSVIFGKKIQSIGTYTNILDAALRIFFKAT